MKGEGGRRYEYWKRFEERGRPAIADLELETNGELRKEDKEHQKKRH